MDKNARSSLLAVLALTLACVCVPSLRAQNQSAPSAAASAASPQAQTSTTPAPTAPPTTPAAAAAPQPLAMPSMTAPLQTAVPHTFNAGPFGTLDITGIISGMGLVQGNWIPGDRSTHWDLSNGQVFLQKTTGWWQFYLQAGAYNLPALGASYLSTVDTVNDFFGPLPQGYLKLVKGNFSVEIGALPTLIGAEYTFTFENTNIERGLLWNQENAVNRGVQINDSKGKLSGSLSWNDGFYSNRYTWLWGSLSYAFNSANTLAFVGGGNLGHTAFSTLATPVQNNSDIYNVIYTYSHEAWMVQPYFQYTDVPTDAKIGITQGAATRGVALLTNYNFKHGVSLAGRAEYISSTGNAADGAVNLLYGPGSGAWSLTLTPAYQNHGFFIRGDFSLVQATNYTAGDGFGPRGLNRTQPRGVIEAGFLF
ncbi:MAG TPA: outer membrane beta-barrel protein [Terriglobia bacterium]|nr:outer membrane beta-barrel protein [Terriglobia bacterium]